METLDVSNNRAAIRSVGGIQDMQLPEDGQSADMNRVGSRRGASTRAGGSEAARDAHCSKGRL